MIKYRNPFPSAPKYLAVIIPSTSCRNCPTICVMKVPRLFVAKPKQILLTRIKMSQSTDIPKLQHVVEGGALPVFSASPRNSKDGENLSSTLQPDLSKHPSLP